MMGALYTMTKALLFPSFECWFMSLSANQAQTTFKKLEDIAKKNIPSLIGSSDVFMNETVKLQANSDGFTHQKSNHEVKLYNGSHITTLAGKPETTVGMRSHLSVYDEAGKISAEYYGLTEPFATQDTNFKTGEKIDLNVIPKMIPTQLLYMSSAEDTSSYLWEIYKEGAKRMMMGDNTWFVADINCEIPLHPTKGGKPYAPLLNQQVVDDAMRVNEYKALREYYNIFDTTGGNDAVINRTIIMRNEEEYLPVFANDNTVAPGDRIYALCFDPALMSDNSIILIGELTKKEGVGWTGRIVNCINLIESLNNGEKKILTAVEQVERLKKLIIDYNGNAPEYKNLTIFIDPGSGGGGHIYSDILMQNFVDEYGIKHFGLIDLEDEKSALEQNKFPLAVRDVLHLYTATKYKNEFYSAVTTMCEQDLVKFPYTDSFGSKNFTINGQEVDLTKEERRALVEIDLLKEEVLSIKRIKTEAGNIRYGLSSEKERRMHDDRAYCFAAFCYLLSQLRRKDALGGNEIKQDMSALYKHAPGQVSKAYKKKVNPFLGARNPFARRY